MDFQLLQPAFACLTFLQSTDLLLRHQRRSPKTSTIQVQQHTHTHTHLSTAALALNSAFSYGRLLRKIFLPSTATHAGIGNARSLLPKRFLFRSLYQRHNSCCCYTGMYTVLSLFKAALGLHHTATTSKSFLFAVRGCVSRSRVKQSKCTSACQTRS